MKKTWTKREINYVKRKYSDKSTQDIADHLGRSRSSIYIAANKMGLKKSDEYIKKCLEREGIKLKILGADTRFVKGHLTHNKGQKMDETIYEKIKVTMFKSGHKPHNIKYDGHERICAKDGYIYVRVSEGKYKLKHRVIWEQHNGPITIGNIIIFKDGNKFNCNIGNMQMITKKENMERNRVTKYPLELQKLIKLKNQIKQKLNEKQN